MNPPKFVEVATSGAVVTTLEANFDFDLPSSNMIFPKTFIYFYFIFIYFVSKKKKEKKR